jgi:hypothetical protein
LGAKAFTTNLGAKASTTNLGAKAPTTNLGTKALTTNLGAKALTTNFDGSVWTFAKLWTGDVCQVWTEKDCQTKVWTPEERTPAKFGALNFLTD